MGFCALIAGGNWNNGVNAGARTVNLNNYPWNVNTNIGARGACDLKFTGAPLYGAAAQLIFISQNGLPALAYEKRGGLVTAHFYEA